MKTQSFLIKSNKQKAIQIANKITTIIISILLLVGSFVTGYKVAENQQTLYTDNELEMMSYYE